LRKPIFSIARADLRLGLRLLAILIGVPCLLVAYLAFSLREANKISPKFRSVSQSTYKILTECDDLIVQGQGAYETCISRATNDVTTAGALAQTRHERFLYASLDWYLRDIQQSRQDLQKSDKSKDAEKHTEERSGIRRELANWLR